HDAERGRRIIRPTISPKSRFVTSVLACEESTMLKPDVLAILCCPEDHSALSPASELLVAEINDAIRRGQVRNRAGRLLDHTLDGGLAKASGDLMYPIIDGIPVLVREEAIPIRSR